MDYYLMWLMIGLCFGFTAFGVWIGWELWGKNMHAQEVSSTADLYRLLSDVAKLRSENAAIRWLNEQMAATNRGTK